MKGHILTVALCLILVTKNSLSCPRVPAQTPSEECPRCSNPDNGWRVRVNLDGMTWEEAKQNFQIAFGDPADPKFAQRTILGIADGSFTPLTPDSWRTRQADGSYFEVFNITSRSETCVNEMSTITLFNGIVTNILPFTGVELDRSSGHVHYVIGFRSCFNPSLPADLVNYFCNEAAVGQMLTNAKRYACMIRNMRMEDPASVCGNLEAVAPTVAETFEV